MSDNAHNDSQPPVVPEEIRLLSFDIDNTLIDLYSLKTSFTPVWEGHANGEVVLTYNTGRLIDDTIRLIQRGVLPEPHFIIGGVGTHIYDFGKAEILKEFNAVLEDGWDLQLVEETVESLDFPIELQPLKFQHAYKRSYFFEGASGAQIEQITKVFGNTPLDINIVYSGDKYLDFLPKWANKGNALKWLLDMLDIGTDKTLVAGDSGNDLAMFELENIKGIVVANAHEELYTTTKYKGVYHSERPKSEGVIEGLVFYGILPEEALNQSAENGQSSEHLIRRETDFPLVDEDKKKLEFIREGYSAAVQALKYNITDIGFTACSMTHNEPNGTDENYQSVWARDGAITIIGSLPLIRDEEIHDCQRKTFETILQHVSPIGQVPSNVRLSDRTPDYSGVGGICSIDSGLWLIIAFHEYIQATDDMEFLRTHIYELQRVMDWLSAHDGNNDALLEIPEAGDWTDLFGRSYNVLYDEVLWYKANVSFGRLHELLGNYKKAGDYIRWSQIIKKEILDNFWPSTKQRLVQMDYFAEQQFSLGDTQYLLAQITPFDFSWRCDSYANILAFLFGVIDGRKAQSTLRFMLGVGINEPFPISNLYPAVNPGDPDWRPYYTVNLLNLPKHYHNGGIWPFVGGYWVQYIDNLGFKEMALSELYKLAMLNKSGIVYEWEFTEWAHGQTGKPMGKLYQAWSASQYIAACHQLKII